MRGAYQSAGENYTRQYFTEAPVNFHGCTAIYTDSQEGDMTFSAEEAWHALNAALEHYAPGCSGLSLFVADSRTDDERETCGFVCSRCPVFALCDAYASAAADDGYWAGAERSAKRRKAQAHQSPTTADRTVSGTHHQKEEPS